VDSCLWPGKAPWQYPDHKGEQANDGVCLPLLPPLLTLARGGSRSGRGSRSGGGSESGSRGGNGKPHGDPVCQRRCIGPHPIRPITNGTGWLILENVSNLLDGVIREEQVLRYLPESGIWMVQHPLWGPGLRAIQRLCRMFGRRRT